MAERHFAPTTRLPRIDVNNLTVECEIRAHGPAKREMERTQVSLGDVFLSACVQLTISKAFPIRFRPVPSLEFPGFFENSNFGINLAFQWSIQM
jgi:hypothetical protein